MRTIIQIILSGAICFVWGVGLSNQEVVEEVINTATKQSKVIDSVNIVDVSLGMYYWRKGYLQGADAALESIATGNSGAFSKQMELDSLNLELIINDL